MFQKTLMAMALATSVFVVGCGGSSSGSSGGSGGGGSGTTARNDVAGPLDAVQEPVSSQVLAPLATAADGTPLEGVVSCVDQIVVGDTLDIVDTLAAQADAGAPDFEASAAAVQAELTDLVADLQTLLTALAGGTGCSDSSVPAPGFTTNPLAGTPLEEFGDELLAQLATAQGLLDAGGTPDLATLTDVVALLAQGYNAALAQLPVEATTAPVLGPSLGLIGTALDDLNITVDAAATGDPMTTATAITDTVEHLLNGLLVDVLPIAMLEEAGGQQGALTGPIADALAQLSAALDGGFGTPGADLGGDALTATLDALLAPLTDAASGSDPTVVLTSLLEQITAALGSGDTGALPIPDIGGASLDTALAELTALISGAGAMDNPLTPLIDTLTGLLGGLLP